MGVARRVGGQEAAQEVLGGAALVGIVHRHRPIERPSLFVLAGPAQGAVSADAARAGARVGGDQQVPKGQRGGQGRRCADALRVVGGVGVDVRRSRAGRQRDGARRAQGLGDAGVVDDLGLGCVFAGYASAGRQGGAHEAEGAWAPLEGGPRPRRELAVAGRARTRAGNGLGAGGPSGGGGTRSRLGGASREQSHGGSEGGEQLHADASWGEAEAAGIEVALGLTPSDLEPVPVRQRPARPRMAIRDQSGTHAEAISHSSASSRPPSGTCWGGPITARSPRLVPERTGWRRPNTSLERRSADVGHPLRILRSRRQ